MAYEIRLNREFNSNEVFFDGKPSEEIRNALKGLKMRWNRKKACWYGFAEQPQVINVYFKSSPEPVEFTPASLELLKTEPDVKLIEDAETGEILFEN